MTELHPLRSLAGGALIGVAAAVLLLVNGRVAGVSGIAAGVVHPRRGDWTWRALFVAGLLAGGALASRLAPGWIVVQLDRSLPVLVVSGLLVGFGTRLAGGCTSGHGVCGVSRQAPRSLAATATFMATGALAAIAVHYAGGRL